MSIFSTSKPFIFGNKNLYIPQIQAYQAAMSHYAEFGNDPKYNESLIVMPTGSGKSGVMALLPFGLSKKRVLIITPGRIIRETVYDSFDSVNNAEHTFWYQQKVLDMHSKLPQTYLYDGYDTNIEQEKELTIQKLTLSDIVITNIHKVVGSKNERNLINLVDPDFFDLVIIDEAHHTAANMWQQSLRYFNNAKVIKLTATPFRSDFLEISTHELDPIFEYELAEAIEDRLLKDVVKEVEIPGKLQFYDKENKEYLTLGEARKKHGDDFISRSVALSETCSKQVIKYTKETLEMKRTSYKNHQVLAIACNDEHAQNVCKWFNDSGFKATYVSTRSLNRNQINQRLNDFSTGLYDVMVSIQLLGEGYDNPNISIISMFRPYKTLTPYAQAIGRGLRRIHSVEKLNELDNYCNVIHHKELNLDELWRYYKDQENYGAALKRQRASISEQLTFSLEELGFVENESSSKLTNSDDSDTQNFNSIKVFDVDDYESKGLGEKDSFTTLGLENYENAVLQQKSTIDQLITKREKELTELIVSGSLSADEADLLLQSFVAKQQVTLNQTFDEFHDLVFAETLREDFTNWLNIKVDEFFAKSTLSKEGFTLFELGSIQHLIDKPNNLSYIVIEVRKGLYTKTKKSIGTFSPTDFAMAKEYVVNKLDYYLKKYPKEE